MIDVAPRLGDLPLLKSDGALCSGAAFRLGTSLRSEFSWSDGDVELSASPENAYLVTRGPASATSYQAAWELSLHHLQRALDVLSVTRRIHLVISKSATDNFVWWPTPGGLAVRRVSTAAMMFDASASLTVKDAVGNTAQGAVPPIVWHESFRYYRLSQTTTDLFDAYRNAYLALESILSLIYPPTRKANGKPAEGEGQWFRSALVAADAVCSLRQWTPSPVSDPIDYHYRSFYAGTRSALSHAKSGRQVLIPQTAEDREHVLNALHHVISVYQGIIGSRLGVTWPGGFVSEIARRGMLSAVHDGLAMFASDDETRFDSSETSPNPAGGTLCQMNADGPVEIVGDHRHSEARQLWSVNVSELAHLPFVGRAVSVQNGNASMTDVFDERLYLGSASQFEVLTRERITSARIPQIDYPT